MRFSIQRAFSTCKSYGISELLLIERCSETSARAVIRGGTQATQKVAAGRRCVRERLKSRDTEKQAGLGRPATATEKVQKLKTISRDPVSLETCWAATTRRSPAFSLIPASQRSQLRQPAPPVPRSMIVGGSHVLPLARRRSSSRVVHSSTGPSRCESTHETRPNSASSSTRSARMFWLTAAFVFRSRCSMAHRSPEYHLRSDCASISKRRRTRGSGCDLYRFHPASVVRQIR